MKQLPLISLIVGVLALAASITFGSICLCGNCKKAAAAEAADTTAQTCNVAYFRLDKVMANYDMANELTSVFETKANNVSADLTKRRNKIESDAADLQNKFQRGLLTQSSAAAEQQKIQDRAAAFENYAAKKQQELAEENQVMANNIEDAINTFIQNYNAEKGYDIILASQGNLLSMPVAAGNAALDVTDEIIAGLNEAYIKAKNDKKSEE